MGGGFGRGHFGGRGGAFGRGFAGQHFARGHFGHDRGFGRGRFDHDRHFRHGRRFVHGFGFDNDDYCSYGYPYYSSYSCYPPSYY
jgi:hypothetical protein